MRAWLIIDKGEKGPPKLGDWFIQEEPFASGKFVGMPIQSVITFQTALPLAECVELNIPPEFVAIIQYLSERKE